MKIKLLTIVLILSQIQILAQELRLNFDVGYGFNIATESINEGYSNRIAEWETEFKSIIYSHGKGLNFNTEIEYFKHDNIGFGLGIGYLKSSKVEVLFNRIDFISNDVYTARMLRFSPFIKLQIKKGKLQYYSKFGYLFGVLGQIKKEDTFMDDSGNEGFSRTIYNKGISHGAIAGMGLTYEINDRFSFSSEIRIFVQSFGPKKRELVVSTRNGEDRLPELELGYIHSNYVDNYIHEWNPSGGTDFSEPLIDLRRFHPFSSIGLNLGFQYKLVKK